MPPQAPPGLNIPSDPTAILKPPANAPAVAKDETSKEEESPKSESLAKLYASTLTMPEQKLYNSIRADMLENQKMSILMVTGELAYTYSLKGIAIEFRLLNGKDKYLLDQYQYGRDPLDIFKQSNDTEIKKRVDTYEETTRDATEAFLAGQSIDSVNKRAVLVTLALSIHHFNSKKLGTPVEAVSRIESFQAPLIQRLSQVYNLFEAAVTHILSEEDFIKN